MAAKEKKNQTDTAAKDTDTGADEETRSATVANAEYSEPVVKRAEYGTLDNTGWGEGQTAPADKYVDADGNLTDEPPERGKLLAAKGQTISPSVAARLADGGVQ